MEHQNYSLNSILLVDDEEPILKALKRLLMPLKCKVHCANSGEAALVILAENEIDIIISDMRMPHMSGDQLLAEVAQLWPDVERVVLTGFADVEAIINAINKGSISRFLQKPWDVEEIKSVVTKSFSLKHLTLKNQQLEALAVKKNQELHELNETLELKVVQRTKKLEQNISDMQESYKGVLKMFSSLIDSRLPALSKSTQLPYNQILSELAEKFDIDGAEYKQLFFAWQLRHIGKLGFSDALLASPYLLLPAAQQREFQKHPLHSMAVCLRVKPLYPSGKLIFQHREYLDGSGYPKGLTAESIDIRAQIITVLNDYIELTNGLFKETPLSSLQAFNYMLDDAASCYNQEIVKSLQKIIPQMAKNNSLLFDTQLSSEELRNGMILSRDVYSSEDRLLLSEGQKMTELLRQRIQEMELNLQERLNIYVNTKAVK